MQAHHKKTSGLFLLTVLMLFAGMWLGAQMAIGASGLSPYSAVYMETGDIYFGKLSYFPRTELTNAWYIERGENSQLGLIPFKNVFWGPGETIRLNSKNIVFTARLRADSQLAKVMAGEMLPSAQDNGATVPSDTAPPDEPESSTSSEE